MNWIGALHAVSTKNVVQKSLRKKHLFMWLSYGNNFSTPPLVWAWHLYVSVSVGFVNVSIPECLPLLLLRFLPCPGRQVGTCPLWWGWTRGPGMHSSSFPVSTDSLWNWRLSHSPAFPWPMKSLTHLFLVSICVPWYTESSVCIIEHLPNCSPEASWRGRKGEFPFSEELCTLPWGSSWGNVTGAYCRGVWAGDSAGEEGTVTGFVYIASNFILVWNAVTLCWHFGFRVSALLQVFAEEQLWTSFIPAFPYQKRSRNASFCVYKVTLEFRSNRGYRTWQFPQLLPWYNLCQHLYSWEDAFISKDDRMSDRRRKMEYLCRSLVKVW